VLVVGERTRVLVTSKDRTGNMNLYDNWMRKSQLGPPAARCRRLVVDKPTQLASTRNRN